MRLRRFDGLRLLIPPGVYTPRSDTALLAGALGEVAGAAVLELCAGSGAVALTAARRGADRVVAVDRSVRAVFAQRANARLNGLRLDARRGDLFGALTPSERFDVLLANPPYLPLPAGSGSPDARWDAGDDGRETIDRIIDGCASALRPGGRLLLVQSAFADVDQTAARLHERGMRLLRTHEHRGPLGPLAAARREHLRRRGVLGRDQSEETLAVFDAELAPLPTGAAAPVHGGERVAAAF